MMRLFCYKDIPYVDNANTVCRIHFLSVTIKTYRVDITFVTLDLLLQLKRNHCFNKHKQEI